MTREMKRLVLYILTRIIFYSFIIAAVWSITAGTPFATITLAPFLYMIASLINALASLISRKRLASILERFSFFVKGMAYLIFIYYALAWLLGSLAAPVLSSLFVLGVIIDTYYTLLPYMRARSPIVLMTALNIGTTLLLMPVVFNIIGYIGMDIMRSPLLWGFSLAIISMLIRSLRGSKNKILNMIGSAFPSGIMSFLLGVSLAFYFLNVRPLLMGMSNFEIVEWIAIGFMIAIIYIRLGHKVIPESGELQLAEWRKHIQKIDVRKDKDFEDVVQLISTFVDEARKESLIIYLAYILAQRSVPQEKAEEALASLINYSAAQSTPIFPWDENYILAQERSRRTKLLSESLELIDNLISGTC